MALRVFPPVILTLTWRYLNRKLFIKTKRVQLNRKVTTFVIQLVCFTDDLRHVFYKIRFVSSERFSYAFQTHGHYDLGQRIIDFKIIYL